MAETIAQVVEILERESSRHTTLKDYVANTTRSILGFLLYGLVLLMLSVSVRDLRALKCNRVADAVGGVAVVLGSPAILILRFCELVGAISPGHSLMLRESFVPL